MNFNPHLPRGRWPLTSTSYVRRDIFQSTPSSRKVTCNAKSRNTLHYYFNPHLPRGRWHKAMGGYAAWNHFNPHLPRGRWQLCRWLTFIVARFQSTPSSRKVTWEVTQLEYNPIISIHTFLAEGDLPFVSHVTVISVISIHTFLAEGDHLLRRCNTYVSIFQSTPSSRKVTASFLDLAFKPAKFQSTPSSRKVTTAMHWW